jgi:hypothetical protein
VNIYRKSALCELSPKVGDSRYREPTQGRRDLKSRRSSSQEDPRRTSVGALAQLGR